MTRDRQSRRRSLTLVELLVATVLMTILTGSVVFIFIQAQEIFTTVGAKVEVYQYARYAFDQMERDLANVSGTREMEFFSDHAAPVGIPGHCDSDEALPIEGTGNTLRDEAVLGDDIFNHAFTVRQPRRYPAWEDPTTEYHRDSIYFKTVTVVDGKPQTALIEYSLKDTKRERPKLLKKVWRVTGFDLGNPLQPRPQVAYQEQDLCRYVVESRFELFVTNMRGRRPGDYYTTEELLTPPVLDPSTGERAFGPHRNWWRGGAAGLYKMHQCYYDVTHDGGATPDLGIFEQSAPNGPILFRTQRHFGFPQLKQGDTILLWGGAPGFKTQRYTIKALLRAGNPPTPWEPGTSLTELRIQFEEPIEGYSPGSAMEVQYGAAWVPAAVRVKLRIKDAKSLQQRSFARVFKILTR